MSDYHMYVSSQVEKNVIFIRWTYLSNDLMQVSFEFILI